MKIVFIVFISNLKRALSDKKKFVINLCVPIVVIILAMFVNYISSPSINIGIVKNANFEEGNRIISLLKNTKGIKAKLADDKLIKTETILGKYDGVIILNKSFSKNEVTDIDKYFDFYSVKNEKTNDMMKKLIETYLVSNKALNMESAIREAENGMLTKEERVISFLATVLLITTVVNAAIIIRDKEEKTFYRFMYSPNNKYKYILGNIVYNYVFSYIQLFIAIITAGILGMKLQTPIGILLIYGLLLTLLMTTFGTFISCIFKKELYANLFAGAISLILSLIGGTFIIYDKMPKGLQLLSIITPNRWIIKSVQYLEHGTINSINPLIVLMIFSIIFGVASFGGCQARDK
jgi:ABC-type multidrug transport system, permease component